MDMDTRIQRGFTYRHFKGDIYKIITFAKDCNDPSKTLVVYISIEHGITWCREFNEFASQVDKEKYPDVTQKYRFELITGPL